MKTLQQVKDSYAISKGYINWPNYLNDFEPTESVYDLIAKEFAEQTLIMAVNELCIWDFKDEDVYYSAKESILKKEINIF